MRQPTVLLAGIGMCASLLGSASLLADGPQGPRAVRCWGYNGEDQCNEPADLGTAASVAGGLRHTIALRTDGAVRCWGYNSYGQCNVPADLGTAVAVAGGFYHTIALRSDGSVRCWGNNYWGQCNVPADLGTAVAVAGGYYHTIALRADGSVRCWGSNDSVWGNYDYGQCNVPTDLGTAVSVAGGGFHTIALRTDGAVRCWGRNSEGQCNVPADLGTAVSVAGGGFHTIALRTDGAVRCWGRNSEGQCNVPADLGNAVSVAGGEYHNIALRADGSVRCWGYNNYGQCNVPADLSTAISVGAGGGHTIAVWIPATLNLRSGDARSTTAAGILSAADGDTLLCSPWALTGTDIDYRGKSIELLSTNVVSRNPSTTTLFADGASLSAPETIALDGTINVPTNAGISLSSGLGLSIAGNTFVSLGGSILAQNDGSAVALTGDMVLATDAVFNALAPVDLAGTLDILGGVIVSDDLVTLPGSQLVVVNGTVDVGSLTIGGNASSLDSAIVSDVTVEAKADLAASGQIVGDVANTGRVITTDDLVVVGDLVNEEAGTVLAQVGVLYITGDLVNDGFVFGNVITAPGLQGGTGGTQPGDGIRVAGTVTVGPSGELRFVEELWKFSVCGDLSLACPAESVRFNGAEVALDGCGAKVQRIEATSADLGCDADLFEGEEVGISLFGELAIKAGTTVQIVDDFANAPGKGGEAIYARGLSVAPGATLITDGHTIYTLNAIIEGTVDDPSNICEAPDLPSPDINGDGRVNAIDLAYVLTYWGTSTAIADLDRDGTVGGTDLALVLSAWAP